MKENLPKPSNQFTCEMCGHTFIKVFDDKKISKEKEEYWGELYKENGAIVCESCYKKIVLEYSS